MSDAIRAEMHKVSECLLRALKAYQNEAAEACTPVHRDCANVRLESALREVLPSIEYKNPYEGRKKS